MKSVLFICLLAGAPALAAGNIASTVNSSSLSLDCVPAKPCQYASKGLKHCVSRVNLTGRLDGAAKEIVSLRPLKQSREVLLMPQANEVAVTSGENSSISFQSDDGEQWGELKPTTGGRYSGVISVEQDFEFTVTCADRSVGAR